MDREFVIYKALLGANEEAGRGKSAKCINFSPLKVDFDMVFIDPNGSPGILNRLRRLRSLTSKPQPAVQNRPWVPHAGGRNLVRNLPAETQPAGKNRPWVPHAGGQDDGSLHKLPQMIILRDSVALISPS